jgi:hypothetical protein
MNKESSPAQSTVRVFPSGQTIRITPGLEIQPAPIAAVPAFAVVEWISKPDGTFRPQLTTHAEWISLTDEQQSIPGIPASRSTLLRLGRAGFVKLRRITPLWVQIHLPSLIEHLENCEDPEFWDDKRTERYRRALE